MSTHDDVEIPEVTLGLRLHMAMRRAGLGRGEMAAVMHVSAATITRWTSDKGEGPKRLYLEKWAEVCRVPLDWLVGDLFEDPTAVDALIPGPRASATSRRTSRATDEFSTLLAA